MSLCEDGSLPDHEAHLLFSSAAPALSALYVAAVCNTAPDWKKPLSEGAEGGQHPLYRL